jgi:hypothetical protein
MLEDNTAYSEYQFIKENSLIDHSHPFEEGLKRMAAHDIVNAVLLFEAAVQKKADHAEVCEFTRH